MTGAVELEDGTRIEFLNVRLDGLAVRVQERPTAPVPGCGPPNKYPAVVICSGGADEWRCLQAIRGGFQNPGATVSRSASG